MTRGRIVLGGFSGSGIRIVLGRLAVSGLCAGAARRGRIVLGGFSGSWARTGDAQLAFAAVTNDLQLHFAPRKLCSDERAIRGFS
ncbi:MAG: hypothetical protein ACHQ53_00925 [Polyangiales bacterium]